MELSENGINLIKKYEGCRLTAYKPVANEKYWTIGWGHYGEDVYQGMKITQKEADDMLKEDLKHYENYVNINCEHLKLNQNQFDALVSFTYNCGLGNLQRLIRNRSKEEIPKHIEAYVNGASGKLPGLVRRRKEERELYETPVTEYVSLVELLLGEQEEEEMNYNTLDEVPEWAEESVKKAVDKGIVKGTGHGLGLNDTKIWTLVILDRLNLL